MKYDASISATGLLLVLYREITRQSPSAVSVTNLDNFDEFSRAVESIGPLRRGEYLYRQAETLDRLYFIRSGAVKTVSYSAEGTEAVLGFQFYGDLLGLDGFESGRYANSACTLNPTMAWSITLEKFHKIIPNGYAYLIYNQSRRLAFLERQIKSLVGERKLICFLVWMDEVMTRIGHPGPSYHLPMTRQDIGSYLDMSQETVSRMLTGLEEKGLIAHDRRWIDLRAPEALTRIAGLIPCP